MSENFQKKFININKRTASFYSKGFSSLKPDPKIRKLLLKTFKREGKKIDTPDSDERSPEAFKKKIRTKASNYKKIKLI